jgi:orotidine-5'-phosphate decarboxylase
MIQLVPAVDLLFEAVAKRGHVCVGLDTSADYVPAAERRKAQNDAQAVLAFNKALIDAVFDSSACFKVQIAYYEEMGIEGFRAYSETLKYIRKKGSIVIADIKRGDIADTARRYAKAHFSGDFQADFVTLSPYMGMDSIEPWLAEARTLGKGAFVLMRTSNPGMRDFEYLELQNGRRLYHAVGEKLSELAEKDGGSYGYGLFGAVVGCTEREEAAEIRKKHPNLFFLIPGYGAQGGGAKDAALLLRDGNGGVVNASRSIITAWQKEAAAENADNFFAAEAAQCATIKMRDEILLELSSGGKCA